MSPPYSSTSSGGLFRPDEQSETDPRDMVEAGYNAAGSYMPAQGSIEEPSSAEMSLTYRRQRDLDTFSTASSVVSTGTRMSYRTLPQPGMSEGPPSSSMETHPGPIDIVLGRRNFRITARPGSILSISSFDYPAPPYEAHAPGTESNATPIEEAAEESSDEIEDEEGDDDAESHSNDQDALNSHNSRMDVPLQPTARRVQLSAIITSASPVSANSRSETASPPSPPISPATTSANAISAHYTQVVRTIDTNHRIEIERLVATHQMELSQTRNSIDAAYRAEFQSIRQESGVHIASLSAQVQELDNLLNSTLAAIQVERANVAEQRANEAAKIKADYSKKIDSSREELIRDHDEAVRKARNEVEDMWEGRWRDRMRLAGEEVGAAFNEKKLVADCWEEEVRRRWPTHANEIREAVEQRLRKEKASDRRRSASGGSSHGIGHYQQA